MVMAYNGVSSSVLLLPPAFDVAESSLLGEFKLLSNFLDTCNDDERDDVLSRKLRAICKRPLLRARAIEQFRDEIYKRAGPRLQRGCLI